MNKKGQAGAWEGIIIILLVIGMGGLVYVLFKKDSSIYQAGSNPNIRKKQHRVEIISRIFSFLGIKNIKQELIVQLSEKIIDRGD